MNRTCRFALVFSLVLASLGAPAQAATLTWNTFQGGQSIDRTNDVYVDDLTGEIYVCGQTDLVSWGSPVRPFSGNKDGFVAKFDPNGALVWLTFLGGAGLDNAAALASDGQSLYVAGSSNASWGNPVVAHHGSQDSFVAALDPASGALQWNSFYGTAGDEEAFDIDVDGDIYLTGYQTRYALFARLDGAGNLVWQHLIGDRINYFQGRSIRVDSSGDLLVLGNAGAPFTEIQGLTPARPHSGNEDAFLLKVRVSDGALFWYTYLGGPDDDIAGGLTELNDDIYVTGSSESSWGSPVHPYAGGVQDGWVARIYAPNGNLQANTFLGSAGRDQANGIHFDQDKTALYVAGGSTAAWGSSVLRPYTGGVDGFLAELDLGLNPTHVTFLGGPALDAAYAVGVYQDRVFVAGESNSSWSETDCAGCPLRPYTAYSDGFLARLPGTVADLAVDKTDDSFYRFAGESFEYHVTVRNDGPDAVSGAQVADVMPPVLQGVSWACSGTGGATCTGSPGTGDIASTVNLPVGGEVIYVVSATLPPGTTGNLLNTATVTSPAADPNPDNNSDNDFSFIKLVADLGIRKTDFLPQANPGAPHSYTILVENLGPSDAPGTQVTDTFPVDFTNASWTCATSGGATCNPGSGSALTDTISLPAGGLVNYTVSGTISNFATGVLTNTATVAAGSGVFDRDGSNNSATDTTSLTDAADLAITKDDGAATVTAGGTTTYTIVALNLGPSPSTNVAVNDAFPAALSCSWTSIAAGGATGNTAGSGAALAQTLSMPAGASVIYTVNCAIDPAATGTITNTATISGPVFDPNGVDNTATDIDGVNDAADLVILKSDGRLIAAPGEQVVYGIAVTNLGGPSAVNGATVTDTFPPVLQNVTWTCSQSGGGTCHTASGTGNLNAQVDLGPNQSVEFTVFATIDPAAPAGPLTNTATVTSPVADTNPANNTATDTTALVPLADLVVLKSDGRTAVTSGDAVTYTILVSNTGPSDAPSATVTDTLPAALLGATWTCSASPGASCTAAGAGDVNVVVSLPAGSTVTYTVQATVDAHFDGPLSNAASVAVTPAGLDPNAPNNTWTDTTEVFAGTNLSITKTDGRTRAMPGDLVVYTVVVTNAGPNDVSDALVSDRLPSGLVGVTWTCAAAGGAACGAGSGTGDVVERVSVPVGGVVTYTIRGTVDPQFIGTLANTASVVADRVIDTDGADDDATDTTEVAAAQAAVIPTLGGWSLGLLALLLAAAGGILLKARPATGL